MCRLVAKLLELMQNSEDSWQACFLHEQIVEEISWKKVKSLRLFQTQLVLQLPQVNLQKV
ncbi:MAG: hypothetical protein CME98_01980 [Hyphomonas sp.]|nr:hypothetical protein [Hyphomonas sp.]